MNNAETIKATVIKAKAGELSRPTNCVHIESFQEVVPEAEGCVDCIKTGSTWVHLRVCLICGYTGCCNSSPNKHAMKHAEETGHAAVMSMEDGEEWIWCYKDADFIVPRRR